MPETMSPGARSRIMSAIRSRDTKPELRLRRALYAEGVRGWRCHPKRVPGTPDVAFIGLKLALFIDGGFWHGHPDHFTPGKSGAYWDEKIARNQERDRRVDAQLAEEGWEVMRSWDFEVNEDAAGCARKVARQVTKRRKKRKAA